MSYHLTNRRRMRRKTRGLGALDISISPPPDLPPVPDPPPPADPWAPAAPAAPSFLAEIAQKLRESAAAAQAQANKPSVPLPASPGLSTTTKLAIAGGAVVLVALVTR